jgi:hypothetical protein
MILKINLRGLEEFKYLKLENGQYFLAKNKRYCWMKAIYNGYAYSVVERYIKTELEYLRNEIVNERISYGEIAQLQSLAKYIDKDDVLLLEWAGVKERC